MKKNGKGRKEKPPVVAARAQNRLVRADEQKRRKMEGGDGVPATKVAAEIRQSDYFNVQARNIRIRLTQWLDLLSKPQFNSTWRNNKLNYLKLLNLMCQCETIVPPFTSFPHPNSLPFLQNHQINQIIDQVERQVKAMAQGGPNKERSLTMQKRKSFQRTRPTPTKGSSKDISKEKTKLEIDEAYMQKEPEKGQKDTGNQDHKDIWQNQQPARKDQSRRNKPNIAALKLDHTYSQKSRYSLTTSNRPSTKAKKKIKDNNCLNFTFTPLTVSSILYHHHDQNQQYFSQNTNITTTLRKNNNSQRSCHSNRLALLDISANKRVEYWQCNSHTGNATPKYLQYYRQAHLMDCLQQSQNPTDRSSQRPCDCLGLLSSLVS